MSTSLVHDQVEEAEALEAGGLCGVSTESLAPGWCESFRPPPELLPSEWAESSRYLPETSAARGARWRNATTPYLVGIMDATREAGVQKIALMKCHQSGGSEAVHNILGFHMEHDPCPILVVQPTEAVGKTWSKERLADMVRSTPALRRVVTDRRVKATDAYTGESTIQLKMFPGGFLAIGGANSPNTYARWSVRLAVGDDVDRFPAVVRDEGDPQDLLVNRTTSFHDGLAIFVSTPTLKGGRIENLYSRSDQRRYFLQCPRCGRWDFVTWSGYVSREPSKPDADQLEGDAPTAAPAKESMHFRVAWDNEDARTARLECPPEAEGGCGLHINEPTRRAMVAAGEWRPTVEAKEPGLVGFHLPAMISTLGKVTLSDLVTKFLTAHLRGREALRAFINTSLAEGWEERGARVEPHVLMSRLEDYGEEVQVPAPVPVLTCGVDVQADRFEMLVMGWANADERYVIDFRVIPGDPKLPSTRAALLDALKARYRHAYGMLLPIVATCVDTGYATEELYDFVLRNDRRGVGALFATKGRAGGDREPIVVRSRKKEGRRKLPVDLYLVNVDAGKLDVMGSLSISAPGPRYTHFPQRVETVTEEFFAQLCAEHRETRYNKLGAATHWVWVQDRDRNEVLDCAVLNVAARRILRPLISDLQARLEEQRGQGPRGGGGGGGTGGTPPPPPARRQPRGRRRSHSSYLQ